MSADPSFDAFFATYKDDIVVNPNIEIRYNLGMLFFFSFVCVIVYTNHYRVWPQHPRDRRNQIQRADRERAICKADQSESISRQ